MSFFEPESGIPLLEVRNCSKEMAGGVIDQGISFSLGSGEVLSILGENGAGKSTLAKVICGLHRTSRGEILVRGQKVRIQTARDAIDVGIGMVHQVSHLIPTLTVAENIVLGQEPVKGVQLNVSLATQEILRLAGQCNWEIEPNLLASELSVAVQVRVQIVRALYRRAEILILDEPTAYLTPQEIDNLFELMRQLAAQGVGIIFVTPSIKEAMTVADRILVLKKGHVAGMAWRGQTSESELSGLMMLRKMPSLINKEMSSEPKFPVLEVEHIEVLNSEGLLAVNDLTLTVNSGEVLVIAGSPDNGQTELLQAINGSRSLHSGKLLLGGRDITLASPRNKTQKGICGYVPENPSEFGWIESFTVAENLMLKNYNQVPLSRFGLLRPSQSKRQAFNLSQNSNLQCGEIDQVEGRLSRGDLSRLILAREAGNSRNLLIMAEPTRGVDEETAGLIHTQITLMRNQGTGVLLVSYDLDEIINLADRIAVLFRGRLVELLPSSRADRNQLGMLMTGLSG